jgi:Uma2 family endonuclease
MPAVAVPVRYTAAEYLSLERAATLERSEFVNGHIYAMSGASREHNLITVNVSSLLNTQLRGRPCEVYTNDMRVQVNVTGAYFYPDVVVVCGEPQFQDANVDTLTNPTVIIEVLSPSTEGFDRGGKFAHYRRLASLQEYVLIAQDHVSVERFVRRSEEWVLSEATEPDATISLAAIDCRLALADVYERVSFPPDDSLAAGGLIEPRQ